MMKTRTNHTKRRRNGRTILRSSENPTRTNSAAAAPAFAAEDREAAGNDSV